MPYTKQTWVNGAAGVTPLNATRLNYIEDGIAAAQAAGEASGAGVSAVNFGQFFLDSATGATDDARYGNSLSTVSADTYPRIIKCQAKNYAISTAARSPYTGWRLEGTWGYSNPERNSGTKTGTRFSLSMNGGFMEHSGGDVFSLSMRDISFTGGSSATVFSRNASATGTLYCFHASGIYASGCRSLFGTQASKMVITAADWWGTWEVNNCYSGAFHLGGSDNVLWRDGMLLDSGTAFNSAGASNGQYHIWMDSLEKSDVGPVYETAEGAWAGIRQTGPATPWTSGGNNMGGPITYYGLRLEGRNAGAESNGSLFRLEGGIAILDKCWISYGMGSPATPGHSPADAGMIHQTGGILDVDGCTTDFATGVSKTTVPFVYSAGGEWGYRAIKRASKGGSWGTTRPGYGGTVGPTWSDSTMVAI